MTDLIRAQILRGIRPDPRSPLKTREEQMLDARALVAIAEWRLVRAGVTSYEALGYGLPGGGVAEVKLREFLTIDGEVAAAWSEKYDQTKRRL